MAIQKTEVIVLRTTKLRETSLIVTFFSRDFGKFQGLTKGVRQPGSPWAGLYEPMNRLEVIFYEKFRSDIHLVTEGSALDLRQELRKNFKATAYGYYLTELLEHFANVGEADLDYWNLIENAYRSLLIDPLFVSLVFQLKLLQHSGFFPNLEAVQTGLKPGGEKLGSEDGEEGHAARWDSIPLLAKRPNLLTLPMIQGFRYLVKEDWDKALQLRIGREELEDAETVVSYLITAKLEKIVKSRRFLNELNQS